MKFFPPAHPVICGDARRAARTYAAGSGGGREQRAGGRADHGKQQQQARSHVRAAGVGEGGWAGPGGREAEAQCALPGPPPTPAAAGRRGCGVLFTAKPQASRSQRGTGPPGLSEASGLVSRRGRRCLWLLSEFREQIAGSSKKLAGIRRRRHLSTDSAQAPKRRPQSSGSAQRIPTPT